MHEGDVLRRRLRTQRLTGPGLPHPQDAVGLLGAVQSQEWAHAFWSVGQRTAHCSYADVRAAFDAGRFLRTHVLRPTWHFVLPADIRWMLQATSPRVQALNAYQYRRLELDNDVLDRTAEQMVQMLAGANHLTRNQIGTRLSELGLQTDGPRLAHVVMNAELRGLICSGPIHGAQHTYALLDERAPVAAELDATSAQSRLALRFFLGHGPASVADLARWSSLTVAQAARATASVAGQLASAEVDGTTLWFDPDSVESQATSKAFLLPLYDECTLSYPKLNFPPMPGNPFRAGQDRFVGSVIVDDLEVGSWRRTVTGSKVLVETDLAPGLTQRQRAAVDREIDRLVAFLGLEVARPS